MANRVQTAKLLDQSGSVLVIALLLLFLVATVGVSVMNWSAMTAQFQDRRHSSSQAFYYAQAGLERVVGEVYSQSTDWTLTPAEPLPRSSFETGWIEVSAVPASADEVRLMATGITAGDSITIGATLHRGGTDVMIADWTDPRWEGLE